MVSSFWIGPPRSPLFGLIRRTIPSHATHLLSTTPLSPHLLTASSLTPYVLSISICNHPSRSPLFTHPPVHPGRSTPPSMPSPHHYFLRTNWQRVRPPLSEHQPKPARPSYQPLLPHFRACPKCPPQVEGTISASTVKSVVVASVYSPPTVLQPKRRG